MIWEEMKQNNIPDESTPVLIVCQGEVYGAFRQGNSLHIEFPELTIVDLFSAAKWIYLDSVEF